MGKLIATTQATVDGVIDPVGEWVQADGDHGDYSFERQARSSGLVLGRKTYEGLAGYWPSQSGKWADMVNPMPKYVGSRTLSVYLEWNATLLAENLQDSIPRLKNEVDGDGFDARERRVRVRSRGEGPDRRVRGLPEPARVGQGKRPRARRQGNHLDGARGRDALRLRSGSAHLPPCDLRQTGGLYSPNLVEVEFCGTSRCHGVLGSRAAEACRHTLMAKDSDWWWILSLLPYAPTGLCCNH